MRWRETTAKALWWASAALIACAALALVTFVVATLRARYPYWGEAEVLFEASRVRQGYPLFVDPLRGALEYGTPPSRYYVTYPPLVTYALALVPASVAVVVGRGAACLAWFGALAWIAVTSPRACRRNAVASAAFVGGIWIIGNFAMTARPDSFACAFAAIGLVRSIRQKRVDAISAVLLVLAPWTKPTLLGLPAGALLGDAIVRRSARGVAVAGLAALLVGACLYVASDGHVLEHVVRSNAQPFTAQGWLERMSRHLPFFAPLFVLALAHGIPRREDPGVAIGVFATSLAIGWTLVAIAKTGSSANYWMEPCIAAVALVAHAPGPFAFGRSGIGHAAITFAAALYTDVASIPTSIERIGRYRREAAFVATVRERCVTAPNDVVAADEQGIELAVNGRIVTTAYQMAWLVRAGRFPADTYVADLTAPNVKCLVLHSNALEAAPSVASAARGHFVPLVTDGEIRVLSAR